MRRYFLLLALSLLATLTVSHSVAQQTKPCSDAPLPPPEFVYANSGCEQATNFVGVPLIDGTGQAYGNTGELIALYGLYGNDEHTSSYQAAQNHYGDGTYRQARSSRYVPTAPCQSPRVPMVNRPESYSCFSGFRIVVSRFAADTRMPGTRCDIRTV